MSELKPCPFCGGESKLETEAPLCLILHWVRCSRCGAITAKHPNKEKVIKEWNDITRGQAMKTPNEIKQGLKFCIAGSCVPYCKYGKLEDCGVGQKLIEDTLTYIEQLEAKDVKQAQRIAELEQELAAVERERNAAVADIKTSQRCSLCIHCPKDDECETSLFLCMECDKVGCVCRECFHGEKLEWRGVRPNTEVQEDA